MACCGDMRNGRKASETRPMPKPARPWTKEAAAMTTAPTSQERDNEDAPSLDYSRTVRQKSHRASGVCDKSGVETLHHTHARRLDGYSLHSATALPRRDLPQAGARGLRPGVRQLRRGAAPAQGA